MTCYLGSGHLIPYHGWGLIVWAVIVVVVGVLLFLSFKYQKQIEDFLQRKFKSKKEPAKQNAECAKENVSESKNDIKNEEKCDKNEKK